LHCAIELRRKTFIFSLTPRFSEVITIGKRIVEAVSTASGQKPLKRLPDHTGSLITSLKRGANEIAPYQRLSYHL
jgi:hypothetical protein